ncbi:MAG: nuclear transport factor 2 family protein [Gemmatimonadaceae bacterium]
MRQLLIATLGVALGMPLAVPRASAQQPAAPVANELPSIALAPELARVLRDYEAGWGKGDAGALSLLFAEDGFVMQSGKPPVRGRAAIKTAYTGSSGGPLKLRALAAVTADSVGYIVGAYGYEGQSGDIGKFTLTLKRARGGAWVIFSDIDNASRGMQPPG